VALGFTLVFGVSRVLNLAYGALYMVTAYTVYDLVVERGWSVYPSAAVGLGVCVLIGVSVYLLCSRWAPDPMRFLISTLLIALFLQYLLSYYFQGEVGLTIPGLIAGPSVLVLGVSVSPIFLLAGAASVLLLALVGAWVEWHPYGRLLRATSEDPEVVSLFGIDPRRVSLVVVGVSSLLVGAAAVLIVPAEVVTPTMWIEPFVIAFVVTIVGGLGKFRWTLPASFLVAFTEVVVLFWTPYAISDVVAFLVAIAFILVRPQGMGGSGAGS